MLDIDLEQPEEYVSMESTSDRNSAWAFNGITLTQVRELMAGCGIPAGQISQATVEAKVENASNATIIRPGADVVLALAPEARAKLYTALSQWPENKYMAQPYHLPGAGTHVLFGKSKVEAATVDLVRKLSYIRNGKHYFSDPEVVLNSISSAEGKLQLLKALTYQTAVLARLHVDTNSDLDKILGYWGAVPGVRVKDLRPLLESIKNTPEGGSISLLYLLPPFARERLYTFPLPAKDGDTKMDCHWTALNFFSEVPDNRFQDTTYASAYIRENFYQIGKPSMCGDLVFVLDEKGGVIHSAVYIADDLFFTKNGVNYGQPWILMRMESLRDVYTFSAPPQMMFYRRKEA